MIRKEIEDWTINEELELLGIKAKVYHISSEDGCFQCFEVVFNNYDDLNYYKLCGVNITKVYFTLLVSDENI